MRYLYPRSVRNLKYSTSVKKNILLPSIIFSFLIYSKKSSTFKLPAHLIVKELKNFYPPPFSPKSVCWINSRARWVFRDFHFSRGVIKQFFISGNFTGFKPAAWLLL